MQIDQESVSVGSINQTPVFADISGKRWEKIKYIFFAWAVLILSLILLDVLQNKGLNNMIIYMVLSIIDALILFTTVFSFIRLISFIFLSLKYTFHKKKNIELSDKNLLVSIIISAYNEENVICKTVDSILNSTYENYEIIIVNDGSTDNTSEVIKERYKDNEYVTLIDKINSGKSNSINLGIQQANGEIIILIDADTIMDNCAVANLVRHFKDKEVAAVSGNILVGNGNGFISRLQNIEYITSLNFDKKALAEINSINVVPGALGAWRLDYVKELDGFKMDTLAEDAELTLNLLSQKYTIKYDDEACAYTEVPENLKDLIKQRHRWCFGTLQCVWKNRHNIFKKSSGTLGWITLPYMIISQCCLPLISVFLFPLCLLKYIFSGNCNIFLINYILMLLVDYIIIFYSFVLGKNNKKDVGLVWIFRIFNKYFSAYILLKSLKSILLGSFVGWGKLKRTGNVRMVQA